VGRLKLSVLKIHQGLTPLDSLFGLKGGRVYGCVAGYVAEWGASSIRFHAFGDEGEPLS
jgi:hypothetical protein